MTKNKKTDIPCFERDSGKMPVLGFGTFQMSGDVCRNAVKTALDAGYRHIDTARMYENEKQVGLGIKDSGVTRYDIFLTTKLDMGHLDAKGVQTACETSLTLLDMDYVNLLLIHWPEESVPLADTLGAMSELKEAGKIRHLGVSNFTVDWLNRAVDATAEPIFCNQIEYHPYLSQGPVIKTCRDHGIATTAYSPLARGKVVEDERLKKIAEKHGKTPAQTALRWLIDQPGVIAIPKGSSEEHIRENINIFDFELDKDDLAAIGAFEHDQRLIDPDWAPEWDTYLFP